MACVLQCNPVPLAQSVETTNQPKEDVRVSESNDSGTVTEDEYVDDTPETISSLEDITNLELSPQQQWGSNSDDEECESPNNLRTEIERRRALSLQMQQQFLQKMQSGKMHTILVAEANLRTNTVSKPKRTNVVHKRRSEDPTFRFGGYIPAEKRKSARLQKANPEFSYTDLPDDDNRTFKRNRGSVNDLSHIEDIVYQPKAPRPRKLGALRPPIIPVEDITEKMLSNIATRSSTKVLDTERGTSCHQCRQKTIDTKTCCRNVDCVGVRGQFCGCCIRNRYGEDAAVALLDPDWICFVCRGVCNCSFCRAKAGKKPTGILAPLVQKYGYQSVHQFLDKAKSKATGKDVLGFSSDSAHTKDGKTKPLICQYKTLKEIADEMDGQEDKENMSNLLSDSDSSSSDDEDMILLTKNRTIDCDISDDSKSDTELKESVDVDQSKETDALKKQNGGLLKISGSLFGSGKKSRKPESPAPKKRKNDSKNVLGFSADGKEVVLEGNIHVVL